MNATQALARAELELRATRYDLHASRCLAKLAACDPSARDPRPGRSGLTTSFYWRRARCNMQRAAEARAMAAILAGGAR